MTRRPLRLFVAVYPPDDARDNMLGTLRDAASGVTTQHRVTPFEQLHLTLHFIGDTDPRDLADATESVKRAAAGVHPFTVTPRRIITLPHQGEPRLVALETDAPPELLEIHRRLTSRFARKPRAKPSDRFVPHITLCRFDGLGKPDRLDSAVSLPPFEVRSIALMQSLLTPAGTQHLCVEDIRL